MCLNRRKTAAKAARQVSSAMSGGKENNQNKRKPKGKSFHGKLSGTKKYPADEWNAMSEAQQKEVGRLRKAARGDKKKSSGDSHGSKRNASAASSGTRGNQSDERDSDSGSDSDEGKTEAPFGRRAHKASGGKKSRKDGGAS
jgi:hypothetical protein